MRITRALVALFSFSSLTSALPDCDKKPSWGVEGFAKENPIGLTTGGKGGATVTVSTPAALKTAVAGDTPKIIHIVGEMVLPSRLKVGSNKSLIGVGATAHITGSGIDVFNGTNVIIQNLRISFITGNDGITIRNSTRVWVDHNEFHSDIEHGPDAYVSVPPPFTP